MALPEKKTKELISMMNSNTSGKIPPFRPILELFDMAMDEKTLDYLLKVGPAPHKKEELQEIYHSMYNDGDEGWMQLWEEVMVMGFLHPMGTERRDDYQLSPIFPGWIEMSSGGPLNEKRRAILDKFMEFWGVLKKINVAPFRYLDTKKNEKKLEKGIPPRVAALTVRSEKEITLNQPLTSQQEVWPTGSVYEVLSRFKDEITVINCFCRQHKTMHGGTCDQNMPVEGCVVVGPISRQLLEYGIGRNLTYEEACEMMADFEKKGCVHTTYHYGNNVENEEFVICNCCRDCCLLYKSYREGAMSKILARSFASPKMIDESRCVGCNKCGRVCPTDATYYDKKAKKLVFDYDKCIGCGQCVNQCNFNVREMVDDPRDLFVKTIKKPKGK